MDDQRERHLIGDLLADDIDDVFNNQTNVRSKRTEPVSRVCPAGSVGGPVGRPTGPAATYWPEPPPPYTPQANVPWNEQVKRQEVYAGFHRGPPVMHPGPGPYVYMPPPHPNAMPNVHNQQQYYGEAPYMGMYPIPVRAHPYPMGASAPPTPAMQVRNINYNEHKPVNNYGPVSGEQTGPHGRTQSASDCLIPDVGDGGSGAVLPRAGLSYRDVASAKTIKAQVQPMQPKNLLHSKISAGAGVRGSHSSSDSQSEEGCGVGVDVGEEESRKLALLLAKEQDEHIMENTQNKHNTTNANNADFQKIVRRKGRGVTVSAGDYTKDKETNIKKDTSRFEVLAKRVGQMSPGRGNFSEAKMNNTTNIQRPCVSKQAYITNDLSGVDDDTKARARKQKQRRDSSFRRNASPIAVLITFINAVCVAVGKYVRCGFAWFIALVSDILTQTADLIVFFCNQLAVGMYTNCQRGWFKLVSQCRSMATSLRHINYSQWYKPFKWKSLFSRNNNSEETLGLEHNIHLPATGDEAMDRLLSCRGRDAYSILGLRADCTDADIKQYYKRQAVLVHPDKNGSLGADEAFRILATAFDQLNTPEKRQHFSLEAASAKIKQMMNELRNKVQEALSSMHCDCGQKHRRYAANRSLSDARYCRKCKEHHPARENDIWAESQYLGLMWYYLACMDGVVYDVTEWARCPKNLLKHMKANAHTVQYRLITGRNTGKRRHRIPNDAEVDEMVGNLLTPKGDKGLTNSASYQPPIAPTGNGDARPRKAGRRRKIK